MERIFTYSEEAFEIGIREANHEMLTDIYRYFAKKLKCSDLSEQDFQDIFQETMIEVWQKISKGGYTPINFIGYFLRIFNRKKADFFRRKKKEILVDDIENFSTSKEEPSYDGHITNEDRPSLQNAAAVEEASDTLEENAEGPALDWVIASAMSQLSPTQSGLLNALYFDKKSHAEIAAQFGLTVGSSKASCSRALSKLKIIVKSLLQASG